ncbi:Di-/tripeptide transporter [Alloactinosynnema sp. L-07]|uniref:peptide MFS transporter n=1 Tax=Alloactinosynnema sp. L-07 TaxID=1653480 RepID=UPI00065F00EF|nr:peptide MFS transporter [Alloactinosynnema sp. L-07]CRK55079.1 Di-/tripeptide transporter [Alloactinosynnema sp. L-07]
MASAITSVDSAVDGERGRIFRDQPRWFSTLFMVDMWERFSFYGMTAILYLYLSAPESEGGFGLSTTNAAAVFGTYMSLMFMSALPGGWLADRVLGARKAVLIGGSLIAAGHYCMSVPARPSLYLGLLFVIAGTGLAKPAISSLVSSPYPNDTERREATISIFYMSIQISAFLAPIITGVLGEKVNWHLGFGAAAVGMTFGLIQYVAGNKRFGEVGVLPERPIERDRLSVVKRRVGYAAAVVVVLLTVDIVTGAFKFQHVLALCGLLIIVLPIVFYRALRRNPGLTEGDRSRLVAYMWLLGGTSVFWLLYAQGGSVLSEFAREHTDRVILGWEVPASWFQSAHPLFILILAPFFAMLWLKMRGKLDVPVKFAGALLFIGVSFLLMSLAAAVAVEAGLVSPAWLLTVFFLQVCGELALAPIAISFAVQIAPEGFTHQYLGLFWLFAALGAGLGGRLAALAENLPLSTYFLVFGLLAVVAGLLIAAGTGRLRRRLVA